MLQGRSSTIDQDIQLHTRMERLMELYPQVIPTLVEKRMACIGCCMAIFDTVEDAARYHHLENSELLAELRAAARTDRGAAP